MRLFVHEIIILIHFPIGVIPPIVYERINNTFEVNCYAHDVDELLNFYDGNDLVDEKFIKV